MTLTRPLRILACALCLWALPTLGMAQPSTNFVKRLADLETLATSLASKVEAQQQLLTAQAKQIQALDGTVTGQALTINALRTALDAEVNNRSNHVDIASNNALLAARQYTDNLVGPVSDKVLHFSRSGNNVYITGANLYVRNGLGATVNNGFNGLGNLIVGYNELRGQGTANPDVRTGSHNLIVGVGANYSRNASIITGVNNTSANHYASVYGGTGNYANATYSVVVGGYNNTTGGGWATILGGRDRTAASQLDHLP